MKKLLVVGLFMLPCPVIAEECQVVEFPDHFEVTCIGDAKPIPIPKQGMIHTPAQTPTPDLAKTQAAELPNNTSQQADKPATPQTAGASQTQPPGGSYAKKPGHQGRPSSADMNTAIEARRKLIEEKSSKNQPAVQ